VDGWVLTGDIGRLDTNGFLYLHDRKNELIISGGFNIWPAELENVIIDLPGVREVVVFGIPTSRQLSARRRIPGSAMKARNRRLHRSMLTGAPRP
jgi:acyl-CoA synthetase (AMP-forming)/AMP-acid ligase II